MLMSYFMPFKDMQRQSPLLCLLYACLFEATRNHHGVYLYTSFFSAVQISRIYYFTVSDWGPISFSST